MSFKDLSTDLHGSDLWGVDHTDMDFGLNRRTWWGARDMNGLRHWLREVYGRWWRQRSRWRCVCHMDLIVRHLMDELHSGRGRRSSDNLHDAGWSWCRFVDVDHLNSSGLVNNTLNVGGARLTGDDPDETGPFAGSLNPHDLRGCLCLLMDPD